MKLFADYLKSKLGCILAFLLFAAIFASSFLLFHIPVRAVLYPLLLCAFFGIIFIAYGFLKYRNRHSELERLKSMTAEMISSLPEASSAVEADYQEIILSLQREIAEHDTEFSEQFRNMTEYYSVWAHQIKTPIASMKLSLQNEDSPSARKLSSDLTRIEQYAEMVLAFIRLDSSATDYLFREYDIDGMLRASVKKFASDFIGKKIRLEYEPVEKKIITDEKWFCFVIEQILSNALKYTREGSVKICMPDENTLCISDTGIGIAPEDLPRIFEKGYTGFNGRLDKSASGIGLYLCSRICRNLNIGISADSQLNVGTEIRLSFQANSAGTLRD